MRFKEQVLKIVREETPIQLGFEWQKAMANYMDDISKLRKTLSTEQSKMLDDILQMVKELLMVQEEWTFYKTFDEITKAWRTLILDEDYATSLEDLMD